MTALLSASIGCFLQAVVKSKNNLFTTLSLFKYKSLYSWLTHKNSPLSPSNGNVTNHHHEYTPFPNTKYYN